MSPDGRSLSFPDDMSDSDIKSVMSKKFPKPNSWDSFKKEFENAYGGQKRGLMDVVEGPAQIIHSGLEKLGVKPPGSTENFTKNRDLVRKQYEESPIGQSETGHVNRVMANTYPYIVPGMRAMAGKTLLARIAGGAFTGGAAGGLQYVPEGGSRGMNAISGSAIGAAVPGVSSILSLLGPILKGKVDPKQLIKIMQSGHDTLSEKATKLYNEVSGHAKGRGIDKIPLTKDVKDLLNETKPGSAFIANTKANQELYKKALMGDYDSLHKYQSLLGGRARKLNSVDDVAQNDLGSILNEKREDLIDHIKNHFNGSGHSDLADKYQNARDTYRKVNELYYPKGATSIGRIVNPELRQMPKDPISFLSTESKPMEKLMMEHPEMQSGLNQYLERQHAISKLKGLGIGTVGASTGAGALKYGYNSLFGDES